MGWNYFGLWDSNINRMVNFARKRPTQLRLHIIDHFDLSGSAPVSLDISPANSGQVKISTVVPESYPWQGEYFKDIPVQLTAFPFRNYKFVRWEGVENPDAASISVILTEDTSIRAIFESDTGSVEHIIINEINYNSEPDFDTEDWIELYNFSASSIDLSGWQFRDSNNDNAFLVPAGTKIEADGYLILCHDSTDFSTYFPGIHCLGNFDFNLSNGGEIVRLFNSNGVLADSLAYDDVSPWPLPADGLGPTLELKNPSLDNALAQNWKASTGHGSPGEKNSSFVGIREASDQSPRTFRVYQNYPNPFNHSTSFSFDLPEKSTVEIVIYNVLGQHIETIAEGRMSAGHHTVRWDTKALNSGVYFYTIKTETALGHGKCLLIK
jgi:hypothetical protein